MYVTLEIVLGATSPVGVKLGVNDCPTPIVPEPAVTPSDAFWGVIVTGVVVDASAQVFATLREPAVIEDVMEQVPVAAVIVTRPVLALTEQAVDEPAEYERVPVPTPPEGVASTVWVAPYARV